MMHSILRSVGMALAALVSWTAQGQICYDATVSLSSNLPAGGPSSVWVTISSELVGVVLPSTSVPLNPETGIWQETFCLYPGCYTVAVQAEVPLSPENFGVSWEAFGEAQEVEVTIGDATMWYTLCVSPEVMSDCPNSIDYVAVDGCLGAFEIGSFAAGEEVVWSFGDGTESVVGGHFAQHEFAGNGEFVVTAWYQSDACPDGVWLEAAVEVTGCGGASDCPEAIDYQSVDGCLGTFEIGGFVEGEEVVWNFLDGSDLVTSGHFIQHEYPGNGTYDVIALYTSDLCPDGVQLIGTVQVTDCGSCTFESAATPLGCGIAQLNGYGLPDGAQPNWYVDGEFVGSGQEILVDGLAPEDGVECYEVVGVAELECGLATSTFEFCMEACGVECPLELEAMTMDGMWWQFMAMGPAAGTPLDWFIDGNFMATTETGTFEAGFDFNPFWEVCVSYASGPCEGQTEACFSYMGGSGCPDGGIQADPMEGCFYQLSIGDGNPLANVSWMVDGTYLEFNGSPVVVEFPDGGLHEVSAYYVSSSCPGETYELVVEANGCNGDCTVAANANQVDCDSFVVWAGGLPEGASFTWTLDGEPFETTAMEFPYTVSDMECHVFAISVTSGACEGWSSEVQICPEACNDCAAVIEFEELATGIYQFTAYTADGGLYTGPTTWWFGEGATMEGNPVAYTWFENTPDLLEVCASFAAWEGCSDPSELCTAMSPAAPGCEEVTFTLNASAVNATELQLLFLMAAEIDGIELGGVDLEGAWNWLNSGPYEVTLCLPFACYDWVATWENWPMGGEPWSIEGVVEWADASFPIWVAGAEAGSFGLEFGWAGDCLSLGAAPAAALEGPELRLFPNPASGGVSWTHFGGEALMVRVMDQTGRAIWSGIAPQFDASTWAPGTYFVTLQTASGEVVTERLVVIR